MGSKFCVVYSLAIIFGFNRWFCATSPNSYSSSLPMTERSLDSSVRPIIRRAASDPVQCGNAYGVKSAKNSALVSCLNYDEAEYFCPREQCHIGGPSEPVTPQNSATLNLIFINCQQYQDRSAGDPNVIPDPSAGWRVLAESFQASNSAKKMNVTGWPYLESRSEKPLRYLCEWKSSTDINNVRPWCNQCAKKGQK